GLYTGTRAAAICAAAFEPSADTGHVDLEAGLFYRKGTAVAETSKRQPPVRIPGRLLAHLRRWAKPDAEGRVPAHVVEFNGKPIESVNKGFGTARELAGLGPDVTPHVLRHTAATWMMQNGADLWDVAGFLGMS